MCPAGNDTVPEAGPHICIWVPWWPQQKTKPGQLHNSLGEKHDFPCPLILQDFLSLHSSKESRYAGDWISDISYGLRNPHLPSTVKRGMYQRVSFKHS